MPTEYTEKGRKSEKPLGLRRKGEGQAQSKAAEVAGISRQEFLEHLYENKVTPYQLTPEELIHEVR